MVLEADLVLCMRTMEVYLHCPWYFDSERHATLLPTNLWGGALRDDTKNSCVADYRDLKHRQRNGRLRRFATEADWAKGFVFGGENEV